MTENTMGSRRAAFQPWLRLIFWLAAAAVGIARAFAGPTGWRRVLFAVLALAGVASAIAVIQWIRLRLTHREVRRAQFASGEAKNPELPSRLQPDGSLLLYGTIGSSGYLLPDGRVWMEFEDERLESDTITSREATPEERIIALVLGARHMPHLRQLLPVRPSSATDCERCGGTGHWFPDATRGVKDADAWVICPTCMGLGWLDVSTFKQLGVDATRP
jgi:hypothetical protein